MSRALVILRTSADRQKAAHWLQHAPWGASVEFKRNRRSLPQNALLWARLTEIAEQVVWYGEKLSAEDRKDVFTASLRRARVVPGIDQGSFVPLGMRTSGMTVAEMSDLMALIEAFAAEHDVQFVEREHAA